MRELFEVDVLGHRLWGTSHPVPAGTPARTVGFLFLNPGHVPRDGHAGLSARAADRLSAQGYPCFRVDLPGLGDTEGPLPDTTAELYRQVCDGGFVPVSLELVEALCQRHGLDGLVLGGLCGAATTSTYLADRDPRGVRGVFLFEPEFYVTEPVQDEAPPEASRPQGRRERWRGRVRRVTSKVFSFWGWMRMLTLENEYSRLFRYVPFPRQALLDLLLDRDVLPDVANVPLVQAWQRVVQRGTPALVLTAEGKLRDVFFERIHQAALAHLPHPNVSRFKLTGTNHIFTTGGAGERAVEHLVRWANQHFPARGEGVGARPEGTWGGTRLAG
ncbi:hypothetical protein KRR26_24070 [Corallococcus sp. M34]|uniref:alpha/beta fold hydrolase n=1 Tax=Citreicoccus inhibens TaxID=2849499 RepID=UPI001C21B847|nr:alpha/beta fold hydrolase [Citreicoccus inhibens]MBU8898693.1 hypothetical protein [Citreicoccus inhibens]